MDLKNPAAARARREPGAPHERRCRAPQQLQRAHPGLPGRQPTLSSARLTGRHYGLMTRIQYDGRRHGICLSGLRGGEHRRRLRLPARAPQCEGRLDPHQRHPAVSGSGGHQRPARKKERHHPGAHGRGPGRRQSAGAGHSCRLWARRTRWRNTAATLPALTPQETPRIFRGAYGIGSRDFRPEHIARRLRVRYWHRPAAPTAQAPRTARPISCLAWTIPTP